MAGYYNFIFCQKNGQKHDASVRFVLIETYY